MVALYQSILGPRPTPAWQIARDAIDAAQTHWEPSPAVQAVLDAWPKDLAKAARTRWDSIGRKPVKTLDQLPWGGQYWRQESSQPRHEADSDFLVLMKDIREARFNIGTDDAEICFLATRLAAFTERMGQVQGLRMATTLADQYGLQTPFLKLTDAGIYRRYCDPAWWRRNMRKTFGQAIENSMRKRGLVCKTKAPYATDWCVDRRHGQQAMLINTLKNAVATSDEGDQLTLFELAEHSNSNPAIRRGELMTRSRGFEEIAKEIGHTWTFATLTTPSAFHATNYNKQTRTCYENKHYEGGSVRAGQAWQCKQWAKVRAKLKRIHVEFYGFRVAEPHHDGTAHWHMLLYCAPHNLETIKRVIQGYWLSEYADELGASEHRVSYEDEDKTKPGSSATGYIAKYIAKNIDGFGVGEDFETGTDSGDACIRVKAWATTHRIRQFQQIGGPPVGLWRELRRIRSKVQCETIEAARIATGDTDSEKKADWAAFVKAVGGIDAGRNTKITVWKISCQELGRYGEPRGEVVNGVRSLTTRICTRVKTWVVQWWSGSRARSGSNLGPVSITVRSENFSVSGKKGGAAMQKDTNRHVLPRGASQKTPAGRGGRRLHDDLPENIIEGTAEYWRWFKEAGKSMSEATRLSWLHG